MQVSCDAVSWPGGATWQRSIDKISAIFAQVPMSRCRYSGSEGRSKPRDLRVTDDIARLTSPPASEGQRQLTETTRHLASGRRLGCAINNDPSSSLAAFSCVGDTVVARARPTISRFPVVGGDRRRARIIARAAGADQPCSVMLRLHGFGFGSAMNECPQAGHSRSSINAPAVARRSASDSGTSIARLVGPNGAVADTRYRARRHPIWRYSGATRSRRFVSSVLNPC